MAQSAIRERLKALNRQCVRLCKREEWLGEETTKPNFRLLYSSVESYEGGRGVAILGINPAGGARDADSEDRNRPFREVGYSAYLDDKWPHRRDRQSGILQGAGQDSLQREVQGLAMILCGATATEALAAKSDLTRKRERRIGAEATDLLRNAPSGNIIPFRGSKLSDVPIRLRLKGQRIGWELLCLARPKLRVIVTLANTAKGLPWSALLSESGRSPGSYHEESVHEGLRRTYREVRLARGPLKEALIIGLPAVVYHRGENDELSRSMFEVLERRVKHHGLSAR